MWAVAAVFALLLLLGSTAAAAESVRLLILGDSITAGYGLPLADAIPAKLEAALKARGLNVSVIASGVSGDTTAGGKARVGWAMADKPDAAIVALGGNDGLRGIAPSETEANLDAIVTRLQEKGVAVMIAGMLAPPNLGREYGDDFRAVFPRVAKRHGVMLYPFLLDGVAAKPDLNQEDGIHPNAKGVEVIVRRLVPAVERLLKEVGQ